MSSGSGVLRLSVGPRTTSKRRQRSLVELVHTRPFRGLINPPYAFAAGVIRVHYERMESAQSGRYAQWTPVLRPSPQLGFALRQEARCYPE